MKGKLVSLEKAISQIKKGATLCTSGFVGIGTPDFLLHGLEQRFLETGAPTDIDLIFAAGQGDGQSQGLNRIAHGKLLRRVIGGHYGLSPKLEKLATSAQVEAYNLPQGCLSQLIRDTAAGKPGIFSKVGLHTFVDPRIDGGKINESCSEDLVSIMSLGEEEWLFYKAIPIDVGLIRGSYADEKGNISLCKEALTLDTLSIAMAAKNSGGIVIAQVESIVPSGTLKSRDVKVPGVLVDYIVEAPSEYHQQTYATSFSPAYSGEIRTLGSDTDNQETGLRRIIA
ncbi:MAG: malonate decarboxylase subunit alpha, partial [Sneathiella sp.]|nr:malonate decarboxylase subunit alpha [Sneathiella sp.]